MNTFQILSTISVALAAGAEGVALNSLYEEGMTSVDFDIMLHRGFVELDETSQHVTLTDRGTAELNQFRAGSTPGPVAAAEEVVDNDEESES